MPPPSSEVESLHKEKRKSPPKKPELTILIPYIPNNALQHGYLLPAEQQAKELAGWLSTPVSRLAQLSLK